MEWATKRKLIYGISFILIVVSCLVFMVWGYIFPSPTCSDGKYNGFETGVDCGGECMLRCEQEITPLLVEWSRAIPLPNGKYDVIAMVINKNSDNASYELGYHFEVYDKEGNSIAHHTASTTPPLLGKFPIIVQNVTFKKEPAKVITTLMDTPHYKLFLNKDDSPIVTTSISYEGGETTRVYVNVFNATQQVFTKIPVSVVLYDENDNAYAVGKSFIDSILPEKEEKIIITWPQSFIEKPTRIGVYPYVSPFSVQPRYE